MLFIIVQAVEAALGLANTRIHDLTTAQEQHQRAAEAAAMEAQQLREHLSTAEQEHADTVAALSGESSQAWELVATLQESVARLEDELATATDVRAAPCVAIGCPAGSHSCVHATHRRLRTKRTRPDAWRTPSARERNKCGATCATPCMPCGRRKRVRPRLPTRCGARNALAPWRATWRHDFTDARSCPQLGTTGMWWLYAERQLH